LEPFDHRSRIAAARAPRATPLRNSLLQRITGSPSSQSNLDNLLQRNALRSDAPKRIVICADGTWNSAPTDPSSSPTNVWLMYDFVAGVANDGLPQLKYYHSGVGTLGNWFRRVIDGMTGRGLSWNMLDCYEFLVRHYNPGDALYLFGFSRGAYTVRTLAGLIRNSGIIKRPAGWAATAKLPEETASLIAQGYKIYRGRTDESSPSAPLASDFRLEHCHPDFHIAAIGVWDTVGALGIPVENKLISPILAWNNLTVGFHDVTLSSYVDRAFHALAVDEQRGPFRPTLWVQQPSAMAAGQICEQRWFAGVHSDVGGGYVLDERGLADVTLRWMVNRVAATCGLDIDIERLVDDESPRQARIALHDSMSFKYKAMGRLHLVDNGRRFIDSTLGSFGQRDATRLVTESLHDSVMAFCERFREAFPLLGKPYEPVNVYEYRKRLRALRATPPVEAFRDVRKQAAKESPRDAATSTKPL
jgi:uncharacterized protein (DUF2235 family)